jgi:hypothetical protein
MTEGVVMLTMIVNLLKNLSKEDEYFKEKEKLLNHFLNLIQDLVQREEYLIKPESEEVVIWAIEEGFDIGPKTEKGWICKLPKQL